MNATRTTKSHKEVLDGTKERPRISVFRSNQSVSVQVINDEAGKTILSASFKDISGNAKPAEKAMQLGELIATKLKDNKITKAVFDRRRYRYHAQVKAVAEGMRKGGIEV
ncbi:MAG: 50S ribosomal protein L18 [bacterium ADurb.Bin400]|nr:MAG: 50S ribosomal protein L18 [bacterium ADurb.Bin400]